MNLPAYIRVLECCCRLAPMQWRLGSSELEPDIYGTRH